MVRPPYVVAVRAFANAANYWTQIDGEAGFGGADLIDLPVDRFINVVIFWLMKRVKDPERLMYDLQKPLPGEASKPVTKEDLEQDGRDFMSFAAAFGVMPPKPKPQDTEETV